MKTTKWPGFTEVDAVSVSGVLYLAVHCTSLYKSQVISAVANDACTCRCCCEPKANLELLEVTDKVK